MQPLNPARLRKLVEGNLLQAGYHYWEVIESLLGEPMQRGVTLGRADDLAISVVLTEGHHQLSKFKLITEDDVEHLRAAQAARARRIKRG